MKRIGIFALTAMLALLAGCAAPVGEKDREVSPIAESPVIPDLTEESPPNPAPPDLPDEIEVAFPIEGTEEVMTLQRYRGENFFIYVDEASFAAEQSAQGVKFVLQNPDGYPEVSMSILYEEGGTAAQKAKALAEDAAYTDEGERQIGERTALWFHAKLEAGAQWDSATRDVYFIDGEDGVFTITTNCYLEAAEGWGARMYAMIGTFAPA